MPSQEFTPISLCVATISDTRSEADDRSGNLLAERAADAGHVVAERAIVRDDVYQIRALVARWIADSEVQAIITTGGTGFTGRDSTPEAIAPLLDKEMIGFGELFRALSYEEIGTSTMQSRAVAGLANATFVFCLPGSTGACKTGWDRLINAQLDSRTKPCNLIDLIPRLLER